MEKPKFYIKPREVLKNFKFWLAILVFNFGIFNFSCFAESPKYVRVAIVRDAESLSLLINGFFEMIDSRSQKVLLRGKYLKAAVSIGSKGIIIGGENYSTDQLFIEARDPEAIVINAKKYRGNIQFIIKETSRLSVINYIDLEDYVKGILYHEVSHYWPQEALKAQAIVSRAYAVYQIEKSRKRDYDVTSDIYSQVYGGKTSERYRTNKAVDETNGLILAYRGKIFPAYFHAACGGHTEDASLVWDINIPTLKGVLCNFCKDSPHYSWHQVLGLTEIKKKLLDTGLKECGDIKSIFIIDKDNSGRIKDLKIETNEKEIKISAKDFRSALSPNIIKSTNFAVHIAGREAVFEGFGWGHGVGMCQWGAYFMAKQGSNYKQILQYYYPQSNVETIKF